MKNEDVIHAFVRRKAAAHGNLRTDGRALLSYNVPIAVWGYEAATGIARIFVTSTQYSVTTSRHTSEVLSLAGAHKNLQGVLDFEEMNVRRESDLSQLVWHAGMFAAAISWGSHVTVTMTHMAEMLLRHDATEDIRGAHYRGRCDVLRQSVYRVLKLEDLDTELDELIQNINSPIQALLTVAPHLTGVLADKIIGEVFLSGSSQVFIVGGRSHEETFNNRRTSKNNRCEERLQLRGIVRGRGSSHDFGVDKWLSVHPVHLST